MHIISELSHEEVAFLLAFFLTELHVYVIPEELRFLKVFAEYRSVQVSEETREFEIEFEDRVVIVPQKYEEN